jgi:hypothetical protein
LYLKTEILFYETTFRSRNGKGQPVLYVPNAQKKYDCFIRLLLDCFCVEKTKRIKSFQRRSGIGMFRFRSVAKTIFIAFPASVAFLCGEQVINRLLLSFA